MFCTEHVITLPISLGLSACTVSVSRGHCSVVGSFDLPPNGDASFQYKSVCGGSSYNSDVVSYYRHSSGLCGRAAEALGIGSFPVQGGHRI